MHLAKLASTRIVRAAQARPAVVFARSASIRTFAASTSSGLPSWEIRMLYDGDCPLCMREVDFLRSRDAGKGKIDFVDIASPNYTAEDNYGISFDQAMASIHAITREGRIVTGIEVFRKLYEAVGLGWVYAITANPTIEKAANAVYDFWAKYRMEITGREALSIILEKRRQAMASGGNIAGSACGEDGAACDIPAKKA